MPSIDIDRDAAHRAAQDELSKPIYSKGSARGTFRRLAQRPDLPAAAEDSSLPGGWFTATVLFILLAIAVIVGIYILRRTMRTRRGGDYSLFEAAQLTAAQHRATAESYAADR